ncbi:MAG: GLUG motif-containing protein, partial [Sedimentisphaerales bacterium]
MGAAKIPAIVVLLLSFFILPRSVQAKYSGGTGGPDDPYLISTAEDMNQIGRNYTDWDKCFKLTADINLSAYTGTQFSRIGPDDKHAFSGVFDGNGRTISGFTYTTENSSYIGVFGNISTAGRVENVSLVDVNVTGYHYVGGLVGHNDGTISNCNSTGSVSGYQYVGGLVGYNGGTISNCSSTGSVGTSNSYEVGGLVGHNDGTISNCNSTGSVSGYQYVGGLVGDNYGNTISNCYSTGAVTGGSDSDYLGGLVGYVNYSYVTDCYAAGEVAGDYDAGGLVGVNDNSTITRCYSSGSVSAYMYVGGLLGWNYSGTTADSFWDTNTSGQSWSAGGTGKTTVEMKTKST